MVIINPLKINARILRTPVACDFFQGYNSSSYRYIQCIKNSRIGLLPFRNKGERKFFHEIVHFFLELRKHILVNEEMAVVEVVKNKSRTDFEVIRQMHEELLHSWVANFVNKIQALTI